MSVEKGIVHNPISNNDDSMADIFFCQDLEQYIGVGACCHDMSCTYAAECSILRDSMRGRW